MKFNITFFMMLTAVLIGGCQKYVDIKTQGGLVPGTLNNYRLILNNTGALENGPKIEDYSSDDVSFAEGSNQLASLNSETYNWELNAYGWKSVIYPVGTAYQGDVGWNNMYNTIAYTNVVISEVPTASGGIPAQKAEITAEALVHRADAYLMLVNLYAKPYNAATAATDLGVPLLLTTTVSQSLTRATVKSVYDQIIGDLKKATLSLPNIQAYNTLPSKASAYAELARCYLAMSDYAKANMYADSTLALRGTINNMGAMADISSYPLRKNDPEILLSKIASDGANYGPTVMRLSTDLLNLLGTSDQRYNLFTADEAKVTNGDYADVGGRFFYKDQGLNEARNIGPTVPEMILIKAEYYARSNAPGNAMLWVNKLRKNRFIPADYLPLTAINANDALIKVIEERHREFFCRMLRWWDMRRLKNDALFQKNYVRTVNGVDYTLTPNSNRYVFQIAEYLRSLNPEIQQNP